MTQHQYCTTTDWFLHQIHQLVNINNRYTKPKAIKSFVLLSLESRRRRERWEWTITRYFRLIGVPKMMTWRRLIGSWQWNGILIRTPTTRKKLKPSSNKYLKPTRYVYASPSILLWNLLCGFNLRLFHPVEFSGISWF